MHAGATPDIWARVAEQAKINTKLIEKWVSAVDLARVTGVKAQHSELMVVGGVPTMGRLAEQEAGELRVRQAVLNKEKKLTCLVLVTRQLNKWIEPAQGLPQLVSM